MFALEDLLNFEQVHKGDFISTYKLDINHVCESYM